MKKTLNYAVIQDGYCLFGAGATERDALIDALKCLGPRDDGENYTVSSLLEECEKARFCGDLRLIAREDDPREFDSYMRNQGGFTQSSRGRWRRA